MTLPKTTFWFTVLLGLPIALVSFRFLFLGLDVAFTGMGEHIVERRVFFLAHIIMSPIALAAGVFQFAPKLRARFPAFHRWTGRAYALAIVIGGISGLVLAFGAVGGPIAGWGFGLLSLLWLVTTAQAIRFAIQRRIPDHRRWMIRSFSLTLAAVTLRLYLPLFLLNGFEYGESTLFVAWLCWVPNILIAEWYLRRKSMSKAVSA